MFLNGQLYYVLKNGRTVSDEEADLVVHVLMSCQENPGGHPLQTIRTNYRMRIVSETFYLDQLFSHTPLKNALSRRGFELNIGVFSASESSTLIENMNSFFESRKLSKESIWKSLNAPFYRKYKLFLDIGKNLNRSS